MKRIWVLVLVIVLIMVAFTSCIVIPRFKKFNIEADTVLSIEIYDLRQNDSIYGGFLDTESPAYEIPEWQKRDFLNDLGEIQFRDTIVIMLAATDPSFYYDEWTVRINYIDGTFELVSCDGYGATYNQEGVITSSHHFSCEDEIWKKFVGKYVPESIFGDQQ